MPGIYIHIPFCKHACSYCDFHFSTSLKRKEEMIQATCQEIATRHGEMDEPIHTLYFGGGTPSVLEEADLKQIFETLQRHHDLGRLEEVTLEANPEDISDEKLLLWQNLGIDRLSIGTQSFFAEDLRFMNRHHSPAQAVDGVKRAQDHGFENITIDLIYGIPQQSFAQWQENVERALELNTPHLSSYCLTIEPRTALHHALNKGDFKEKSEEAVEEEYLHLHAALEAAGFEHYEISNFSKTGWKAKHNSAYWSGLPYIGYGPSAHSFDGLNKRSWNVANNARYIQSINKNSEVFRETETLSLRERWNEVLMTGLRTESGLDLQNAAENAPQEWLVDFRDNLEMLTPEMKSYLVESPEALKVNPKHWLKCDAIVRELIVG